MNLPVTQQAYKFELPEVHKFEFSEADQKYKNSTNFNFGRFTKFFTLKFPTIQSTLIVLVIGTCYHYYFSLNSRMTRSCHTEQQTKKRLDIVKMTTNNTIHRVWLLFIILFITQSTFCKQFTSVICMYCTGLCKHENNEPSLSYFCELLLHCTNVLSR